MVVQLAHCTILEVPFTKNYTVIGILWSCAVHNLANCMPRAWQRYLLRLVNQTRTLTTSLPGSAHRSKSVAARQQGPGIVSTCVCILDLPSATDLRSRGVPEPHQTLLSSTTKWIVIIVLSLWVAMKEHRHMNGALKYSQHFRHSSYSDE